VSTLCSLQHKNGRFEGEMVWNTMLLSQYVLTHRMVGRWPLSERDQELIRRHYEVTQLSDGSWPLHIEGPGSVFVTTLGYVALRVMGVLSDDPLASVSRRWLRAQREGPLSMPTWGRIWLAMLGVYEYEGVSPIPPELFILPRWFPLHPIRMYCHTRYVYLSLACLYGRRFRVDLGALAPQLRAELYGVPYSSIRFADQRHQLGGIDVAAPHHRALRVLNRVLALYERHPVRRMRVAALRRCVEQVADERETSNGLGISAVNALLGCLVLASDGAPHERVVSALASIDPWRWNDDAGGLRIVGNRSSAWDTSFAIRAIIGAPETKSATTAIVHAYRWLDQMQVVDELPGRLRDGRDRVRGGWCFADNANRWPVSDCTAEALTSILAVHERCDLVDVIRPRISDDRIFRAVQFILDRQNRDGGFGTYERTRAPRCVERLNPSEMYTNCMTELSHVECTASCVTALARFRSWYPEHRRIVISAAVERGVDFLRSRQNIDGSYPAAWGIHFSYSAFFVAEALTSVGLGREDRALSGLAEWLVRHQRDDGGWGEHYSSCLTGHYVEHPESQAAMTAWAVLALTRIAGTDHPAVRRGRQCLLDLQDQDSPGQWPRQAPSGIFFGTAVLDYRLYKDVFPTWALTASSRWRRPSRV
jgi:lanosterol synthase